jgi:hypothetical protein
METLHNGTPPAIPIFTYSTSTSLSCLLHLTQGRYPASTDYAIIFDRVPPYHPIPTCPGTVPLVNWDRHPLASNSRYEVSISTVSNCVWHSHAGSLALLESLAHAGHMLASLLCSTTSKTLHRVPRTSVPSPNREPFPISENEGRQSIWGVLGTGRAPSGKRLSTSVTADRARVGR